MSSAGYTVGSNQHKKTKKAKRHAELAAVSALKDGPTLAPSQVAQCSYAFVPAHGGNGDVRQCKNAVIAPATHCHVHGGATATSLGGKSVAKATAEANRGELHPVAEEFWDGAEARYEALQGQVTEMLAAHPKALADMVTAAARQQKVTGVGRFSAGNQLLVLFQHWGRGTDAGLEPGEAASAAVAAAHQPHMTKAAWAKVGREPGPDARPVYVTHFQTRQVTSRTEGESDEDFAERLKKARGHNVVVAQYPMDDTSGEPYEAPDPMAELNQGVKATADPEVVRARCDCLADWAGERGLTVDWSDTRPGGADGCYNAATSTITVWKGAGGGDPAVQMHVLAHEIGHAQLGHLTTDHVHDQRGDLEAQAETFAYLVSSRMGVDATEATNVYVSGWQKQSGVDLRNGNLGSIREAVKASDDFFADFEVEDSTSKADPVESEVPEVPGPEPTSLDHKYKREPKPVPTADQAKASPVAGTVRNAWSGAQADGRTRYVTVGAYGKVNISFDFGAVKYHHHYAVTPEGVTDVHYIPWATVEEPASSQT